VPDEAHAPQRSPLSELEEVLRRRKLFALALALEYKWRSPLLSLETHMPPHRPVSSTNGSSGFDAETFFARLAQSGAEHAQIVEQRPGNEAVANAFQQFGSLLYEWGDVSRRIAAHSVVEDPDRTYAWFPHFDSLAHGDFGALEPMIESFCGAEERLSYHWLDTNPTRNPASWGIDFLQRCFHTVIESVTAIGALVATGQHLRAPLTLARSVVEAGATGCFIIDATVEREERVRRILNLHFAQVKEQLLESGSSGNETADAQAELDELILFAEHCGYRLKRYQPGGWFPPTIASTGRQPTDSTRAIIDQVLPGLGSSIWRNLSAVAHGRAAQLLVPDEFVLPHLLKDWQRTESVAWHGMAALVVVKELCVRIENYLGWGFAEMSEVVDDLVKLCFVAGGLADERIREGLGLPPVQPWTL
jgi:hypothetical protein